MPELKVLLSREAIAKRVAELGEEIARDFRGQSIIFVGVLKGAAIFLSDLARQVPLDATFDFIAVSYTHLDVYKRQQAELEDTNRDRIELLAHLDCVPDVIAMPVGADEHVGLLDILFALRALGIAGNPRIDVEGLPFRRLDAEGSVAQPCELDSFKIHETLLE